jgi:hypothetical protein
METRIIGRKNARERDRAFSPSPKHLAPDYRKGSEGEANVKQKRDRH